MRSIISVAVAAAIVTATGCGATQRAGEAAGEVSPVLNTVSVRVVNDNFQDVDVYAVHSGISTRIGTVVGNSSGSFTVDRTLWPSNELSLVAVPIGGFGRASSGRLSVGGGDNVEFHVM